MKLADADLLRLLPAHLSGDAQLATAAEALRPFLGKLSRFIPNLLIYARLGNADCRHFLPPLRRLTEARPGLDPLDMETLEALAWQFHVDFREVAGQNREQLAGMVRDSIAWHRIKGTPASLKAAFSLFGFGAIHIREHEPLLNWAAYELGFDDIPSLETLALILKVCQEMQPARCRLWRVYTSEYDYRPGVWSGKMPDNAWSYFWWSGYSGTYFPELPGLDDRGLLVSFALKRRLQTEPWAPSDKVYLALEHLLTSSFPLLGYPIWSRFYWGERFPARLPFAFTSILSLHGCEMVYEGDGPWLDAPWQNWPWAKSSSWGRKWPHFSICPGSHAKNWFVWSEDAAKADKSDVWPASAWPDAPWPERERIGWSSLNSFWSVRGTPVYPEARKWGEFFWSEAIAPPRLEFINEFFSASLCYQSERALPDLPLWHSSLSQGRASLVPAWRLEQWPQHPWYGAMSSSYEQHWGAKCEQIYGCRWLGQPWPDFPWNDQGQTPCALAGQNLTAMRTEPCAHTAQTGTGSLNSALCGNAPALPAWGDGVWPECSWQKVLGYKRGQQPIGVAISEISTTEPVLTGSWA